jgi:hypothetical protein
MSGDRSFELEDLESDNGFHDPSLPPPREGLRRTRQAAPPGDDESVDPGPAPAGWIGWVIAPTVYYFIATLSALAALFIWFNPTFGFALSKWPWEAVQHIGRPELPAHIAVALTGLIAASVGGLIGLGLGPRRIRPGWMATVFLLLLLTGDPSQDLLLIPVAFLAGILLSGAPPRRRRGHLFACLLVLGGVLLMPLDAPSGAPYASIATEALQQVKALTEFEGSWLTWVQPLNPVLLALSILTLGGLAWMGLGGPYVRWLTGGLLLASFILGSFAGWHDQTGALAQLQGWQAGASSWAAELQGNALALLLPLSAAVCEWQRQTPRND